MEVVVLLVVRRGVVAPVLRSGVVPRSTLPGAPRCAPRGVTPRRGVTATAVASTAVAVSVVADGAKVQNKF